MKVNIARFYFPYGKDSHYSLIEEIEKIFSLFPRRIVPNSRTCRPAFGPPRFELERMITNDIIKNNLSSHKSAYEGIMISCPDIVASEWSSQSTTICIIRNNHARLTVKIVSSRRVFISIFLTMKNARCSLHSLPLSLSSSLAPFFLLDRVPVTMLFTFQRYRDISEVNAAAKLVEGSLLQCWLFSTRTPCNTNLILSILIVILSSMNEVARWIISRSPL